MWVRKQGILFLIALGSMCGIDYRWALFCNQCMPKILAVGCAPLEVFAPLLICAILGCIFFNSLFVKRLHPYCLHLFSLFSTLFFALFLLGLLKMGLGRARPYLFFSQGIQGFFGGSIARDYLSCPSSHAAMAYIFAYFIGGWYPTKRLFFYCLAILFSLSRTITCEHFISDVLLGGQIGHLLSFGMERGIHPFLHRYITAYLTQNRAQKNG